LLVLLCLAALCVARIELGSGFRSEGVPDHDAQFDTLRLGVKTQDRFHQQHRDEKQRRHDKAVVQREERHEEKKESDRDDDDNADDFDRDHHTGRLQNRIDRNIETQIQNALHTSAIAHTTIQRQAYQLRCGRNATEGANGIHDSSTNRTIGPLVVIAKTSQADVTADSFDGNNDGHLDVLEARNAWQAGRLTPSVEAANIEKFVLAIRNRATVNGGSINLRSIVRTGRAPSTHKKPGAFFTFSATTVLITPCFPVTNEPGYNIVIYAGGVRFQEFNHTLLQSPNINATELFTTAPNGVLTFSDGIVTAPLIRISGAAAGDVEGQCVFQLCTQHAYFQ